MGITYHVFNALVTNSQIYFLFQCKYSCQKLMIMDSSLANTTENKMPVKHNNISNQEVSSSQNLLDQKPVKYSLIIVASIVLIGLIILLCRRRDKMKKDEQMRLLRQN